MKRRLPIILATGLFVLAAFALAFAEEGNARKGKYLYRKNCRSCHGTSASDLSPNSKTQAEWKATFAKPEGIACNAKWPADMQKQDITDIFSYLHDFAKDSPSPAKCS